MTARRNLWGYEETITLISILEEKEYLKKVDEKIFKPNEIYLSVEQEMFARGHYDKTAKQIEFRWKNLRKMYFKDKRMLEIDNKDHKISPYFDKLDSILAYRVGSKKEREKELLSKPDEIPSNFRTIATNTSDEDDDDPEDNIEMPAFEECFPTLPASKPRTNLKRPHEPDTPPKIEVFQEKIKKVARELNEDLFRKQKELVEYEFRLFANYTTGRDARFKEVMATNTQTFLRGIQDILQKNNSANKTIQTKPERLETPDVTITEYLNNWDKDASNKN